MVIYPNDSRYIRLDTNQIYPEGCFEAFIRTEKCISKQRLVDNNKAEEWFATGHSHSSIFDHLNNVQMTKYVLDKGFFIKIPRTMEQWAELFEDLPDHILTVEDNYLTLKVL